MIYEVLASNEDDGLSSISPRKDVFIMRNHLFRLMAIVLFTCVGFFLGQATLSCGLTMIPLAVQKKVFHYKGTFGADPEINSNTQAAWDSIIPLGQGSVRYPDGSEQIYTLSMVHQLHCLWSIHQNYYRSAHMHVDPERLDDDEHASSHMRHCFDYLRQSLMCAADSSLEPVDSMLGGVTGWGNERSCRDYAELVTWAEHRRVSNVGGFS